MTLEEAEEIELRVKERAASLLYHGCRELRLDEEDFTALFLVDELSGLADQHGRIILFTYRGLKIIRNNWETELN